MATKELIASELLFFIQNKFGCRPCEVLQRILVNFYSENSIVSAKQKFYNVAKKLLGDNGVGEFKDRRSSGNKKKLDTQDVLEL